MDPRSVREKSKATAADLGYEVNSVVPLLEELTPVRSSKELADRLLGLFACVASAYGYSRKAARRWIEANGLWSAITESERRFLATGEAQKRSELLWRVEGLWCLAWAVSMHDALDVGKACADDFVTMFPPLDLNCDLTQFRSRLNLRSLEDLVEMLDLTYCLHWSIKSATLNGSPVDPTGPLSLRVIEERRRALEWVFDRTDWDEISLDT